MDSSPDRPRAAVVVNPAKIDLARLRQVVTVEEERAGWQPSGWFPTAADDDGVSALRDALATEPDVVLVAGGDGTLRSAAELLAGTGIPLTLIPVGTANNFARELGIPMRDLTASVAIAFSGVDRPIDVGWAELVHVDGRTTRQAFLAMAGLGVDAQMAANVRAPLKKRIGWLAYIEPIAKSIIGNRQFDAVYSLDGEPERRTRAHSMIVGNSGYLPAGLLLLPGAAIDDGLLDAVLLRPGRGWGWSIIGGRVAMNRFLHRTEVGRHFVPLAGAPRAIRWAQASRLTLRLPEPQEMQLSTLR